MISNDSHVYVSLCSFIFYDSSLFPCLSLPLFYAYQGFHAPLFSPSVLMHLSHVPYRLCTLLLVSNYVFHLYVSGQITLGLVSATSVVYIPVLGSVAGSPALLSREVLCPISLQCDLGQVRASIERSSASIPFSSHSQAVTKTQDPLPYQVQVNSCDRTLAFGLRHSVSI